MCFSLDGFGRKKRTNPVSLRRRRQETGGPTSRSRTSDIQIRRDVAAKWSVFSDSRCAAVPSTVITARSITPCQREKYINTGYCRTPCLTHEWENYPVPSCCSTFILGKQLLTRNHFFKSFWGVLFIYLFIYLFFDVQVTQREHLAFILKLCLRKRSLTRLSDQCVNMFGGDKRTNWDIANVFLRSLVLFVKAKTWYM